MYKLLNLTLFFTICLLACTQDLINDLNKSDESKQESLPEAIQPDSLDDVDVDADEDIDQVPFEVSDKNYDNIVKAINEASTESQKLEYISYAFKKAIDNNNMEFILRSINENDINPNNIAIDVNNIAKSIHDQAFHDEILEYLTTINEDRKQGFIPEYNLKIKSALAYALIKAAQYSKFDDTVLKLIEHKKTKVTAKDIGFAISSIKSPEIALKLIDKIDDISKLTKQDKISILNGAKFDGPISIVERLYKEDPPMFDLDLGYGYTIFDEVLHEYTKNNRSFLPESIDKNFDSFIEQRVEFFTKKKVKRLSEPLPHASNPLVKNVIEQMWNKAVSEKDIITLINANKPFPFNHIEPGYDPLLCVALEKGRLKTVEFLLSSKETKAFVHCRNFKNLPHIALVAIWYIDNYCPNNHSSKNCQDYIIWLRTLIDKYFLQQSVTIKKGIKTKIKKAFDDRIQLIK